ncbi:MAG: hypothetical protein H7832_07475 [Magnetococcus sp. DMHC-6]
MDSDPETILTRLFDLVAHNQLTQAGDLLDLWCLNAPQKAAALLVASRMFEKKYCARPLQDAEVANQLNRALSHIDQAIFVDPQENLHKKVLDALHLFQKQIACRTEKNTQSERLLALQKFQEKIRAQTDDPKNRPLRHLNKLKQLADCAGHLARKPMTTKQKKIQFLLGLQQKWLKKNVAQSFA